MSAQSALRPEMLSIREFARRDGCDESRVRRAIRTGHLNRLADGKLDAALVGTGWRETNRRNAGRADTADLLPADPAECPRTPAGGSHEVIDPPERETNYPESLAAMAAAAGYEVALSLGGRLPQPVVDAVVDEVVAAVRCQGVFTLHEEGVWPPAGGRSWATHPLFTGPIERPEHWETRAEFEAYINGPQAEAAELAAASVQAGGTVSDG